MTEWEFVGLGLMVVSAFHLIPAILTGTIPSRWPVRPLTRDGKPEQFKATFRVFLCTGFVGTMILAFALGARLG